MSASRSTTCRSRRTRADGANEPDDRRLRGECGRRSGAVGTQNGRRRPRGRRFLRPRSSPTPWKRTGVDSRHLLTSPARRRVARSSSMSAATIDDSFTPAVPIARSAARRFRTTCCGRREWCMSAAIASASSRRRRRSRPFFARRRMRRQDGARRRDSSARELLAVSRAGAAVDRRVPSRTMTKARRSRAKRIPWRRPLAFVNAGAKSVIITCGGQGAVAASAAGQFRAGAIPRGPSRRHRQRRRVRRRIHPRPARRASTSAGAYGSAVPWEPVAFVPRARRRASSTRRSWPSSRPSRPLD